MAEVVFRAKRQRLLPLAVFALALTSVSAFFISQGGVIQVLVGGLGLAFFGIALLVAVFLVVRPPTLVAMGPDGVTVWERAGSRRRRVSWEKIDHLRLYEFHAALVGPGIRMLGLVPLDPSDEVWQSPLRRFNSNQVGAPVSISSQLLPVDLETLVEQMQRFKDLRVDHGPEADVGLGLVGRRLRH